jgi:hypothetical protein
MATTTKIDAPAEIRTPFPMRVKDHGLTLVHDINGAERNWLHEVSVRETDTQAINYLVDAGYSESHGWRRGRTQWWVWTKPYPLDVARW